MQTFKKKDPATMQTASGFPVAADIDTAFTFSKREAGLLRELAMRVGEISERDEEKEKARLWTRLNDLDSERPMLFIDPENGWNEVIPQDSLVTSDPLARVWEMHLRKQIHWAETVRDDKVIEPYFDVPYCYFHTGWGVELKKHYGGEGGSFKVEPAIRDYAEDLPKVAFPEIIIDEAASETIMDLARDVFDGILTVRRKTAWWWTLGMTFDYVNLRGLDNLMMDLALQPDDVHQTMALLRDGYLARLDWLERQGYLASNTEGTYVGSGGFGWTTQLPSQSDSAGPVLLKEMWGFCESQETVGISPQMFGEFILPYQIPILDKFGLNCYGCCEPLDARWDYVKTIPNLRRVSASPWSDKKKLAELLTDRYILSAKPSPTPLSSYRMDEEYVRRELREILDSARGCHIELIMKDNHTLGRNPSHMERWVSIAREEIDCS